MSKKFLYQIVIMKSCSVSLWSSIWNHKSKKRFEYFSFPFWSYFKKLGLDKIFILIRKLQ